jgi:hypothetical protein
MIGPIGQFSPSGYEDVSAFFSLSRVPLMWKYIW